MNLRKSLQLNELLIQREGEFLRVHDCEEAIARILDGQYPIPPPPDIPCLRSNAKTASKAKTNAGTPPQRLRTLNASETGYQIHYQQGAELFTDTTVDRKTILWLLRPDSSWEILSIKTVDIAGEVREILYEYT